MLAARGSYTMTRPVRPGYVAHRNCEVYWIDSRMKPVLVYLKRADQYEITVLKVLVSIVDFIIRLTFNPG